MKKTTAGALLHFSNGRHGLILGKLCEENHIVLPLVKKSLKEATHQEVEKESWILQGWCVHTLTAKTIKEKAEYVAAVSKDLLSAGKAVYNFAFLGEPLPNDLKTGEEIKTEDDPRMKVLEEDLRLWAKIFMPDHEEQL